MSISKLFGRGAKVLTVAVAALATWAPSVAQAAVNDSPAFVVVYDNNIENWSAGCGSDLDGLIAYMKKQSLSPDVFLVQQVTNQTQLNRITAVFTAELPGVYDSVIAIPYGHEIYPGSTSTCEKAKNVQTNAIIYRTGRFDDHDKSQVVRWRSDAPTKREPPHDPVKSTSCANLEPTSYTDPETHVTVKTSQDRVENVAIRLYDRWAKQEVTVASFHWPTSKWNGPDCAWENIKEANERTASLGTSKLTILGGDANATKGASGWWNDATVDYKYRDPIAETCGSSCPPSTSTSGTHRIDYLLVKSALKFGGATTIQTNGDHKALTAKVYFK